MFFGFCTLFSRLFSPLLLEPSSLFWVFVGFLSVKAFVEIFHLVLAALELSFTDSNISFTNSDISFTDSDTFNFKLLPGLLVLV